MVHPQLDIHGSCRSRIHEQNTYTHFQDWSFICVCRTLERSTPHGTHDLNSWIAWNAWNVWRLSVTQRLYLGGEFNVVFFGQLIGTLHNLLNTSIVLVSIIGNTHTHRRTHTHTHTPSGNLNDTNSYPLLTDIWTQITMGNNRYIDMAFHESWQSDVDNILYMEYFK